MPASHHIGIERWYWLIGLALFFAASTQAAPAGNTLIPEHFLRRWDPVTLFFNGNPGPTIPGAEDHPEHWVTLTPAHPGAWQWLDSHTLQFRPAEPWPALTRFSWTLRNGGQERVYSLATLMEAPQQTLPEDGEEDLEPLDAITLTFAEPLDPSALARMVDIEMRPLPGLDAAQGRHIPPSAITIKPIERAQPTDPVRYVLQLREPIPAEQRILLHLHLSLDDTEPRTFKNIAFSTRAPFRISSVGCSTRWGQHYPITPDGTRYPPEQAMSCGAEGQNVTLRFSAPPRRLGLIEARNLVRFSPVVDELTVNTSGKDLSLSGRFRPNTVYRVNLVPIPLQDEQGRVLEMRGASELYLYFASKPDFLDWQPSRALVERFGPQMLPLAGRGFDRMDVRVYSIDPLERGLWPFPQAPVVVDEGERPPGPGEEPAAFSGVQNYVTAEELAQRLRLLGSPPVSELVDLPLRREGTAAHFGLDLAPYFRRISGQDHAPGTYLVGIRRLDGATERAWVRVQVTDLSLSTVEEPGQVRFIVTSLATGAPVAGAEIQVEGAESPPKQSPHWETFFTGATDAQGQLQWQAPGARQPYRNVRRIQVRLGEDHLMLDPTAPPDRFHDNRWRKPELNWLQWAFEPLAPRLPKPELLCHLFTERPVYRPEDKVHIKGYLRTRSSGELHISRRPVKLVVEGPNELTWRYPVEVTEQGSFYHLFDAKTEPTGPYKVYLEEAGGTRCGELEFLKDAYRLPTFEVQLQAADPVPQDQAFDVKLVARYYAGGSLAKAPVRWRVAQFPYTWTPARREGFIYSSEARFSHDGRFETAPVLERTAETDEDGAALLGLDPGNEISAQPRTYAIEATVTGRDDQTVTNTRRVNAVPALVLGVKIPRYLERAKTITPEIIAVGPEGALKAGAKITLRLAKREWHSHLQLSDFTQGEAKYITEMADRPLREETFNSTAEPLSRSLVLDGAGVYLLELTTHDRLGRAQTVAVDFYVSGDEAQTWSRPPPERLNVTPDRPSYIPGDTAHLVIESPFQQASVLAVVEAPEGVRTAWIDIAHGAATFDLLIQKNFTPRLPVHFVLMRGRNSNAPSASNAHLDLGRPTTLAATTWVKVEPVEHQLKVALDYPAKAKPGDPVSITVHLSDHQGRPAAGEVTLWLVDKAVLALGKEQFLDPLPGFITPVHSRIGILDTRNFMLGWLPFEEQPGGDGAAPGEWFDKVTVRKRFDPVPYYNPAIPVGPNGEVTITLILPDDLTTFKLRAKAISGEDRFGFAVGEIQVRLPVIAQPALPRFLRPGDRFDATALARVVEGPGGPARVHLSVQGVQLQSAEAREFALDPQVAQRLSFPVQVPAAISTIGKGTEGKSVQFTLAVERRSDQARDAFSVNLPLRPDREPIIQREMYTLTPGGDATAWAAVDAAVRPGTVQRELLLGPPAWLGMAAAMGYLLEYPYGCTEQRLSRAHTALAVSRLQDLLGPHEAQVNAKRLAQDLLDWLPSVIDDNNLVAYWPGDTGRVSLTAWTVAFLVEARAAGLPVAGALFDRLTASLKQALRSDYAHFIDGEAYSERVMALYALAAAGQADTAYAAELARRADTLNLEDLARVAYVLGRHQAGAEATVAALNQRLWEGIIVRQYRGKAIYGGLQDRSIPRNALILPSETRTLAEVTRALTANDPNNPRLSMLTGALMQLGQGGAGWGSTQANAAATLALIEPFRSAPLNGVLAYLTFTGHEQELHSDQPLLRFAFTDSGPGTITLPATAQPVTLRLTTRYLPLADGSQVAAIAQGFVVHRELLHILPEGAPPLRFPLDQAGQRLEFKVGDWIEEHIELVNPEDRTYVAVTVPLAAGMEPLNPRLATAPAEAAPTGQLTETPSYSAYQDDQIAFYYDSLPKGTYHFYFRTQATTSGAFTQPPARAELMYDQAVFGLSAGARVEIMPSLPVAVSNDGRN
jgi:alpha-2-macroglobulin